MSRRVRVRVDAVGVVAAVLTVLLAIAVIAPSFGSLLPDTKPEIYLDPGRSFLDYLWPWQDYPGMGMPSFNVGLAPVCGVVWLIERLGAEPWLAARLLRVVLLLVAGWGAAALAKGLPAVPTWRWAPLVAAALYVASPYTVTAGATLPVLLPLATLPWLALFLLRALSRPRAARWAAAFGLAFAGGSGMNAGVVPTFQLLVVPGVVVLARSAGLVTWRRAGVVVAGCAAWTLLLSLYWIVPTAVAQGSGGTVLANTETLAGIFGPSSLAESVRGLGLWPLYGGDAAGPWQPGFAPYLTSWPVVVCSFVAPALVLAVGSRAPRAVRHGGTVLVVMTLLVMAGAFPVHDPAPLGRGLAWLFDTVPTAAAFRTTNKVGSVLALGLAMLGATGLAGIAVGVLGRTPRSLRRRLVRDGALVGVAGVFAVAAFPLGTGGFYLARYDVPDYWHQAATALRSAPENERIWMVPGERLANFRWSTPSPDDVGRALIAPPSVVRTTVPNGSPEAANLLAAADAALSDPDVVPDVVAVYARYLGAGRVLARYDQAYEDSGALPPQLVAGRLRATPGLHLAAEFGAPGTNAGPTAPSSGAPLPPLQLYTVDTPGAVLSTRPASGGIVLAGDSRAVPSLLRAGLLATDPLVSSLPSMSQADVRATLRDGARVVLTDTNRRAANDTQRITAPEGPLVSRATDVTSTLALGRPEQQTALVVYGGSATTSGGAGSVPLAQDAPENAFDGDATTSWQFGGFGTSDLQSVSRTFDTDVRLGEVVVRTVAAGDRRISAVEVGAGGVRRSATVGPDGVARVGLGNVLADGLTVTVTALDGTGTSRVGVSDVESAGPPLVRVAALPDVTQQVAGPMSAADRDLWSQAPLDIVMTRANGGQGSADDEESSLDRDLEVVGDRNYFVEAMIRPSPRVNDIDFDAVAGFSDRVTVQGSSRAFDLPTLRGSQALDGRDDTAWIPGSPEAGQVLTITSADAVTLDHLTVRQEGSAAEPLQNWVTRATVLVDGREVGRGRLTAGESTLRFPEVEGHRVQLRLDATKNATGTVRISEVVADGLALHRSTSPEAGCVTVLAVDGEPMWMRPASPLVDLASAPWVTCRGEGLPLAEGGHGFRGTPAWSVDFLSLRDARGLDQVAQTPAPELTDVTLGATRYGATTGVGAGPFAVVLAEGRSPGWTATLDGRPLPAPVVVDGFSMGWVVQDSTHPHRLEIVYGPRAGSLVALGVSMMTLLAALATVVLGRPDRAGSRRRSRVGARAAVPSEAARDRRGRLSAPWLRTDPRIRPALVLLLLGGAAGGWGGLALGAMVLVALVLGVRARPLVLSAAVLVAVVPFFWLAGNAGRLGQVSPDLVSAALVPHYLVLTALLALVAAMMSVPSGTRGVRR